MPRPIWRPFAGAPRSFKGEGQTTQPTSQPGAPLASTLMASLCAGGRQTRCLRARAPVAETALAFITRDGFPALISILLRTIINVGLGRNGCQQSCKRRHCRCSNQEVSHFYLPQVLCCACSRLFILSPGCMCCIALQLNTISKVYVLATSNLPISIYVYKRRASRFRPPPACCFHRVTSRCLTCASALTRRS